MADRDPFNPGGPPARRSGGGAPADDDAFVERVVRYLSGAPDADAVEALNAELRGNPAKRELFVRLCLLESRLGEKLAPGRREFASEVLLGGDEEHDELSVRDAKSSTMWTPALVAADLDAGDEPELQAAPSIPKPPPPARQWWQRRTTRAAAAAVLLIAGVWGLARLVMPSPAPMAATLSGAQDVSWELNHAPPRVGTSLPAGSEWGIHRGLVRLTFRDGAEVVIQGPARFIPQAEGRITMSLGRLTALVPPAAKGFTVRTPTAEVVDLGTEFGVDASGGATAPAEVVVFEGHVTLQPAAKQSGEPSRTLSAGGAATIDSAGTVTTVAANPTAYVRVREIDAIERAARGSAYDRWLAYRYELARDPDVVAYYPFDQENKNASPDRLLNRSMAGSSLDGIVGTDADSRPTWTAGRFAEKAALQFGDVGMPRVVIPDPSGAFDFAGEPTDGRSRPFTIAAWIRARSIPAPGSCILGRGQVGELQYALLTESTFYRARVCAPGGESIEWSDANSSNYPSANWHLAVMTYDPAARSVSLYVDGALAESRPAAAVLYRSPGPVMIGVRQDRTGQYVAPVRGTVDEIAVLRRAMTADQVRRMYEAGKPG